MLPFSPILQALNDAGVRYVVVGGVAVLLRGYLRLTGDLDLIVDLVPDEARKAIATLERAGLRPIAPVTAEQFADEAMRRQWIEEKGMVVFSMMDPNDATRRVDVFVDPPIEFEALWTRADEIDAGVCMVRTAAIEDLITMKRIAGRPKDLDDIDALERVRDNEGHGPDR